jgi:hypothetical protein
MKSLVFSLGWIRIPLPRIRVEVLVRAMAALAILVGGLEVARQFLTLSQSAPLNHGADGLNQVWSMAVTGIGALLGCMAVIAGPFFDDRPQERSWILYVYATALVAAGFALLAHWFAVSGGSSSWS